MSLLSRLLLHSLILVCVFSGLGIISYFLLTQGHLHGTESAEQILSIVTHLPSQEWAKTLLIASCFFFTAFRVGRLMRDGHGDTVRRVAQVWLFFLCALVAVWVSKQYIWDRKPTSPPPLHPR